MNTLKNLMIISATAVFLGACSTQPPSQGTSTNTANKRVETVDNAKQHLDLTGFYSGTTPCEDCEEMQISVQLNADNTFTMEKTFKGKEGVVRKNGKYEWNSSDTMIKLTPADKTQVSHYLVGENQLFPLDPNGKLISTEESKKYILKKIR